jgi:amidase
MTTTAHDLRFMSATELLRMLRDGGLTSVDLLGALLQQIGRDPDVNAVVTIDPRARAWAEEADAARARGESVGRLHGLPVTVKDTLETAGLRTTAGAAELARHVPARDAEVVARLRAAGAIVFGKTNTPAWASDCQTYNEVFGTTRNPWDLGRAVGGSSGGSAAALAAGHTTLDIGSDLGGSIRNPAGYCGVFGLRPSYGIIPMRGHVPGPPGWLSEIDMATVGPLARSAEDLELALDVVAGPSARDAVAWRLELPPPRSATLAGTRVAVWLDDEHCRVDEAVLTVLRRAVDVVGNAGAQLSSAWPCQLREAERLAQQLIQGAFSVACPDEEYDRLKAIVMTAGPEDQRAPVRHARNVTVSAREHMRGLEARAQVSARVAEFFTHHDVLVCPITPTTAIPHDHQPDVDQRHIVVNGTRRPYGHQIPWASLPGLCGLPSVVMPVGLAADGLPVGMQVIGPHLEDRTVLAFARQLSELTGGFTALGGTG